MVVSQRAVSDAILRTPDYNNVRFGDIVPIAYYRKRRLFARLFTTVKIQQDKLLILAGRLCK